MSAIKKQQEFNEQRMRTVLDLLTEATQAPNTQAGDALVARAANVLAGVVYRQAKILHLPAAPVAGPPAPVAGPRRNGA